MKDVATIEERAQRVANINGGSHGMVREAARREIEAAILQEREACAKTAEAAGQLRLLDCSTAEMSEYAEGRCRRAAEFIRGRR